VPAKKRDDYRIELYKGRGKHPWHYRLVSAWNSETLMHSEGIVNRGVRTRTARRIARALAHGNAVCEVVDLTTAKKQASPKK